MKKFLFFILSFTFFSFKNDDVPIIEIKTKIDFFEIDNLENIYTICESEIKKFTSNGKLFARYSNLKYGNVSSIDATNPLKIIVYYKDYQQLVFLDNQLSDNGISVSLEKLGYEQTELVCASANNSFWLYNKQNNELVRFNENSKKISSTGNLIQLLKTEISPSYITESNGFLYLNCPKEGIFVFDIFGTYIKTIGLVNQKKIRINENIVYYKLDSTFCSYNVNSFEKLCKNINVDLVDANYSKNKLYLSNKNGMRVTHTN